MKKILFIFVLMCLLGAGCVLAAPTIVDFSVSPANINAGQSATLTWTVNNASSVKIDPFSGNQYSSGSTVVSPPATTTYVLIASNMGRNATAAVTLTVNPISTEPAVSDFSVNPSSINAGDSATLQWDTTGATSIFIEPDLGCMPASGSQIISPLYSTSYVLTASNANSTVISSATVNVNPYPAGPSSGSVPKVIVFDINPPIIDAGSSTTLEWEASGADALFINRGIGDVSPSGTMTISPTSTTSYTITAINSYGSVSSLATVIINPRAGAPTIVCFAASPNRITAGDSSTLNWQVTGATSASINRGIGAVTSTATQLVSPNATTIYTLTATNNAGTVTASTSISVEGSIGPPLIENFSAEPNNITAGRFSLLDWDVTGATSVTIDRGIGTVTSSGARAISPPVTTTYTLTATNSSGSTMASTTVTVAQSSGPPVIMRFSIYPTSIRPGDSSTLQWQVGGATSVSIDQGIGVVPPTGTQRVSPATTRTYKLTATNGAGSSTASVTLTVISETGRPFIDYFSANPAVVQLGGTSTLKWQVTDATSVIITPGPGTVSPSGTAVVSPNETTAYVLAARNSTGVVTHTALVTVTFESK